MDGALILSIPRWKFQFSKLLAIHFFELTDENLAVHHDHIMDYLSGLLEQTSKAKIEGKALSFLPSVGVVDEEKMR